MLLLLATIEPQAFPDKSVPNPSAALQALDEFGRRRLLEYKQLFAALPDGVEPGSDVFVDDPGFVLAHAARSLSECGDGVETEGEGRRLDVDCDDDGGDVGGYCTETCEEWCEWSASGGRHYFWTDPTCTCSEYGCEKSSFPVDGWNQVCGFSKCGGCTPCLPQPPCASWCEDSATKNRHYYYASDCTTKKSFPVDGWNRICAFSKCTGCPECST